MAADSPLTAAIEQCLCLARIAESLGLVLNEVRRALFVLEGALDHFIDHLYSIARETGSTSSQQTTMAAEAFNDDISGSY